MTPADLWLQHRTDVAELDDEPVYAALTIDLEAAATLTVTRVAVTDQRPQGLVLDADAPLEVHGVSAQGVVLWSDRAPGRVTVVVPAGRLTISHTWRDGDVAHAWTGWCGLRRTEGDDDRLLGITASDGHDALTADLEVEIEIAAAD